MKVEKVLSLKSKAEIKLNNLKNDLLRQQKEGISGFVVSLLLILAAIVVGAVYMKLANKGMETIFQDMINRIINGFKEKLTVKNMAKNLAKKKKGSIAIWQIFEIILFAALVYTFITLWPVFLQKQNVDYIAKTMVRAVETNGRIDSSITDLQHELENDFGVELDDVRWTTQYVPGTNKIQIKSKFELTVTDHATIRIMNPTFGDPLDINVPMSKTLVGVSQVFWK